MRSAGRIHGMPAFLTVWAGQLLSLVGSGMTRFALTIWAWQITGQATALALVGFFSFAPMMILSPLAGALVDRWNRKLTMMLSDLAAGLSTVAILILYLTGQLEIWHIYIAVAFSGAFESFQFPAYRASMTMMIPRQHYARATALIQLAGFGSAILAPIAAAALIGVIGIGSIMAIDIATFVAAILMLVIVTVPQPAHTAEGTASRGSLWRESLFGFQYIFARPSLIGLQSLLLVLNLSTTISFVLFSPMILARSGNDSLALGSVQSAFGIGGVIGGFLFSLWGGPKRLIHGALLGIVGSSILGFTLLGVGRGLIIWTIGAAVGAAFQPMLNGCLSAIWHKKVPADLQGRVFAVRRMIAELGRPISMLAAGPLADRILEPGMTAGGSLTGIFGPIFGTGPGAGMGVLVTLSGIAAAMTAMIGYLIPAIRNVEDLLPDQDHTADETA